MSQRLVTIARYRDIPPAGLAQSILEAEGITSFLDNQFMVGVNWLYSDAVGGIKLRVAESDVEEALKILAAYSSSDLNMEQAEVGQVPDFACPKCGGTEIKTIDYQRKSAALSLLLSLPLLIFAKRYQCLTCGHKWK
ncbi:MAG: DUF2007 domain-containing protein [Desulfuromonadaceae bacterium]|jgi:predicted RNA-binding Zn-ribbon protein involved in translation (DUF1610 family)|nr:DUF2007 domain-containing protein [Desulfuromonas sp.]MDY0184624.1 DUF2007 domain-containing protein [Desulfuromonadaceae bacterium]